tara:strand:- start:1474 stop:1626 length:153 start_codon:yes stop_codon:yes gene_type:complete
MKNFTEHFARLEKLKQEHLKAEKADRKNEIVSACLYVVIIATAITGFFYL